MKTLSIVQWTWSSRFWKGSSEQRSEAM